MHTIKHKKNKKQARTKYAVKAYAYCNKSSFLKLHQMVLNL